MAKILWHTGEVIWSGENPFMRLRRDGVDDVTRLSFFRVVWSPKGEGHALLIVTDAVRDEAGDPLTALFTDNPDLGRWLYDTLFTSEFWHSRQFPVIQANFSFHGDTRHSRTEVIASAPYTIELTWSDLQPPVSFCRLEAEKAPEIDLLSIVIPARKVEVRVNGKKAEGAPFTIDFAGRQESSCCLAFSETWLRPEKK